jgi:hypothetical protein
VILFQGTYNASNDYEVPAGTTAVVYFDGAGAGAVAANVFNNAYFDGLRLGSVSVTAILDEDNMASDSATALATQQSIKAYVDSQVGTVDTLAEILAIGNTTGATDIAVDSAQKVQFRDAAIYINSSVDGQLDIVADTEIQLAATTIDIDGTIVATTSTDQAFPLTVSNTDLDSSTYIKYVDNAGQYWTTGINYANNDFVMAYGGTNVAVFANAGGLTVTSADNLPQLTLVSTDADALVGPQLNLWRNSGSAANGDLIGQITFTGEDALSNTITYASIHGVADQVDNGAEDGSIRFSTRFNDVLAERLAITQIGGVTINDTGIDADFRVESDTNANALIVDGATGNIGFSLASTPYGSATTEGLFYTAGAGFDIASNTNTLRVNRNSTGGNDRVNIELQNNGTTRAEFGSLGAENGFYLSDSTKVIISGYSDEVVINETGADMDFRVESDTDANALFVQGSDGFVGIGTSSPYRLLSLYATQPVFQITNVASGNNQGTIQYQVAGSTQFNIDNQGSGSGGVITFMQAGTERMRIDSSGGLITNPSAGGHAVFNEGGIDADFRVESDGNANMLFVDGGNNAVGIGTAAPESIVHIKDSGNVTTTLQIESAANQYAPVINFDGLVGASADYILGEINGSWDTHTNVVSSIRFESGADTTNKDDGLISFWTSSSGPTLAERMRIESSGGLITNPAAGGHAVFNEGGVDADFRVESDGNANALFVQASDGKVGIGTSSPETNNAASVGLTVGSSGSGAAIQLNVNGGGGIFSGTDTINNPNYSYRMGHLNGTNRLEMSTNNSNSYANGVVLSAGGTSWGTFSDERRKTDLVEITDGLNKVSTLRAVTGRYNYDDANVRRSMLIAQDVQAVLPEAVGAMTASMEDPTEYLTLNYTETIPLLVSALKDAKQLIEALTARITALENA